jgi:hypothetical protein
MACGFAKPSVHPQKFSLSWGWREMKEWARRVRGIGRGRVSFVIFVQETRKSIREAKFRSFVLRPLRRASKKSGVFVRRE